MTLSNMTLSIKTLSGGNIHHNNTKQFDTYITKLSNLILSIKAINIVTLIIMKFSRIALSMMRLLMMTFSKMTEYSIW